MVKKRKTGKKNRARALSRQNKAAMLCITSVVCILLVALLYEGHSLKKKIAVNEAKATQLQKQIDEENKRTEDINSLREYMQSDEYLEKTAKEKLGLIRENEIIFKEAQ